MATEQEYNKRRLIEMTKVCLEGADVDAVDEYFAPDFWSIAVQHEEAGAEGEKHQLRDIHAAFSEVEYIYTDLVAVDDRVGGRATFRGVHTGTYAGIEPTGARIEVTAIDINRFVDGKIVEHWEPYDDTPIILQLKAFAELKA